MLTGIQELLATLGGHVHQTGMLAEQIQKLAASETEHAGMIDTQRVEIERLEARKTELTTAVEALEKQLLVAQQALDTLRAKLA